MSRLNRPITIVSWNVNGIRAAGQKGFLDYLSTHRPEILCIQETKASVDVMDDRIANPSGYYSIWHSGVRKGYSGVGMLTTIKPDDVQEGIGNSKFDDEGRVIRAQFGNTMVFSVYFPNGQKDETRLQYKLDFYDYFFDQCAKFREAGFSVVVGGDFNTAHHPIDLANPKQNENYSGFLPVERAWMDRLVDMGYIDTYRKFHPDTEGAYSWWTYRFGARKRNIGWRIDYFWVDAAIAPRLTDAFIQSDIHGSDHCPVGITLELA